MSRAADLAQLAAEESDAADIGAAWLKANPDALLCEAWRHAATLYPRLDLALAFCLAFRNARAQRDAYHQEESP